MDPRDFLTLATVLQATRDEAAHRTCVSRAYYALFLSARDVLAAETLPITYSAWDHQLVPDYLRDSGDHAVVDIGDAIADLRSERNIADYEMQNPKFNQNVCALLVAKAQMSLQVLDGLNPSARRAMSAAIKAQRGLP